MQGCEQSVAILLKKDCPNLFVITCICHSFALCASYACGKLPASVESLAKEVYNYISNSPKRSGTFADIVILLEDKPKKMLHPSATRWLSLEAVVNRLIEKENLQALDNEFREIIGLNFSEMFSEIPPAEVFWKMIGNITTNDNKKAFPLMESFAFQMLSLPNSSANVERIYSQVNLNVTKSRNRLEVDTLSGILYTKDFLKFNSCDCTSFKLTDT